MELKHEINKPVDFIFDYLTDMQKFVSVHPVITKIDNLGYNNYLVYETLKMGFIPFSFTYKASLESNYSNKSVVITATVMKINKIEMVFKLSTENNYTIVVETINFKTFLPIKSIMRNIFKKQHAQLFKNLENKINI